MSVAKVIELTASSPTSFDDALRVGLERASRTLENVTGAWVQDHEVKVEQGRISEYRLRLKVTFILNE
jgi:flavin-binding protein dodecin